MMRVECEFEADVLEAVLQSRWPERVDADLRTYPRFALLWWNLREFPATLSAFVDVITRPLPILGKPEPIFPTSAE